MREALSKPFSVFVQSCTRFNENNGIANSAAIAYYAAFSLPSLLLISISLVGFFVEPDDVKGEIDHHIESIAGEEAADQMLEIVVAANNPQKSFLATVFGGVMLLIGATGVLVQLQTSLNQVWRVEAQPDKNTWLAIIIKRLLSMSMLLVIAFLLLVTISVRALLSEVGSNLDVNLPEALSTGMVILINQVAAFVLISILLASMFRFLPDVRVPWRDVWFGALITSFLFAVGKQVMGYYLELSNPGQVYGAAGSLAVILIWVYYASMIVLFGAQVTKTWSDFNGHEVKPEQHAAVEF